MLLIIGLTFLILYKLNTKQVTGGCRTIASFSLAETETKSFTLRDGTSVVIAVTSANTRGGSGLLKAGEQTESVSFSSGRVEDWNGVRVGMIGTNTSGTRTSLNLVAADCSRPAGTK